MENRDGQPQVFALIIAPIPGKKIPQNIAAEFYSFSFQTGTAQDLSIIALSQKQDGGPGPSECPIFQINN